MSYQIVRSGSTEWRCSVPAGDGGIEGVVRDAVRLPGFSDVIQLILSNRVCFWPEASATSVRQKLAWNGRAWVSA